MDSQCQFEVCLGMEALEDLLAAMSEEGFSKTDYNVMENSCNTFTEVFDHVNLIRILSMLSQCSLQALAVRLGLTEYFPSAVHRQTRLGAILSPLVRTNNQSQPCIVSHNQSQPKICYRSELWRLPRTSPPLTSSSSTRVLTLTQATPP